MFFEPLLFFLACGSLTQVPVAPQADELWRAMHFLGYETDGVLEDLAKEVPVLAEHGIIPEFARIQLGAP